MIVNKRSIYISRLFTDILLLNVCFISAALLAQPTEILFQRSYIFVLLLALNIIWFFYTSSNGFYEEFLTRQFPIQFFNILKITFVITIVIVFFIFLVKEDLYTRNFIVYNALLLIITLSARTIIFKKFLKRLRRRGKTVRNMLILGSGEIAQNFKKMIFENPEYGYNFVGFVDDNEKNPDTGSINELDKLIKEKEVEEVVIALPEHSNYNLDTIIKTCNINAVTVHFIPDYFRFLSKRFQVDLIGNFPIITARDEPLAEVNKRFIKRSFDICFSLVVIVFILSWLYPIIALLIKFNSKGNVLFIQDRVGIKNEYFKCYKFRTLKIEFSGKNNPAQPVTKGDSRITKVGVFLRKTNLDEIPQFFNVLKADMSVVGPRPHPIPFQNMYGKIFDEIKLRHNVRPGITGWAQVNGLRGDVEDEEENKKRTILRMKYDLWYIENWSMKLDLEIILMTIWQMIKGDTRGV